MHQDDIKMAFVEILEGVAAANRADITADHRLREDLGIDRDGHVNQRKRVEDMFGIRIPDEDLELFPDGG